MPLVSFIVSTYQRPVLLACCLRSLQAQTCKDFEAIITDNGGVDDFWETRTIIAELRDQRFHAIHTRKTNCYSSAEEAAVQAAGDYLAFPSDDSYYVPLFLEKLAGKVPADLIYCDVLYGCAASPVYYVLSQQPRLNEIDKTAFLVKRALFREFPGKLDNSPCPCDGNLVDELVRDGCLCAKVDEILVVHN